MFCTLEKAVDWGDKKVQVIILFSVKRNNNEDLQRLYDFYMILCLVKVR